MRRPGRSTPVPRPSACGAPRVALAEPLERRLLFAAVSPVTDTLDPTAAAGRDVLQGVVGNPPALASATRSGTVAAPTTTVVGSLQSEPDAAYRIDFFASPVAEPGDEGRTFVGSTDVTTDAAGGASFNTVLPMNLAGAWVSATATDPAGNASEFSAAVRVAGVAGRFVFYNGSAFDGKNAAADAQDDAAVAADKTPLLPGGVATFANYTSYDRGLNGVIVDLALAAGATPGEDDFFFKVGNDDNPAADGWSVAPRPRSISVRPGAGVNGADRVTVVWDDGAVRNRWLRVAVLPTGDTKLAAPDVFYFGNAVADSGNGGAADAVTNFADEAGARAHPGSNVPVTNRWDYNRDRMVNSTDQLLARANKTTAATALKLINAPAAEALDDFRNVPDVYAYDPARFAALWQSARTGTVRLALLGDSQETSPQGGGEVYTPRVGYEFWREFGNVPETQLVGHGSFYTGGGNPPGEWMVRGRAASPGPSPSRIPGDRLPPSSGIPAPKAHSTKRSDVNVNGQAYGQFTILAHDGGGIETQAQVPTNVNYFNPAGAVRAQVFGYANASSGEIVYKARPINGSDNPFFAPVTTTATLNLGLESPTPGVRGGFTAPLNYNGKRYMSVELHGSADAKLTDVIGLRYRNETHPQGVAVSDLAVSGYDSSHYLSLHGNSGEMFAALGFHAAVIHYGANDVLRFTAEQFRQNLQNLMGAVRGWADDPQFRFILVADPDTSRVGGGGRAHYDRYVGAHFAIAQQDPNVLVVNARRIMHAQGWDAGKPTLSTFTYDGLHYNPEGARRLAEAEVRAMLSVGTGGGGAAVAKTTAAPRAGQGVRAPVSVFGNATSAAARRAVDEAEAALARKDAR